MIERARTFGGGARLAGVLTEPAERAPHLPDVVLWNAGLLHHVGPNRLFVELARALAASGFAALRFDLSGIGDSSAPAGSRFSEDRAVAEVVEAMDYLAETRGAESFVLVGLCSGAVDAHHVAVGDERVAGVVLLDGYGYRTGGYYLRYYLSRAFSLDRWIRSLTRLGGRLRGGAPGPAGADDPTANLNFRRFPSLRQARDEVRALVARGVEMLYVYTGGVEDYFNHAGQFQAMFRGIDLDARVGVHHLPHADHLYTILETRRELIASIGEWARARFDGSTE